MIREVLEIAKGYVKQYQDAEGIELKEAIETAVERLQEDNMLEGSYLDAVEELRKEYGIS
jgi:hypothetical protein